MPELIAYRLSLTLLGNMVNTDRKVCIMEETKVISGRRPGVFLPWEIERGMIPQISGDEALVREVWENIDHLDWTFIWHVLVSF